MSLPTSSTAWRTRGSAGNLTALRAKVMAKRASRRCEFLRKQVIRPGREFKGTVILSSPADGRATDAVLLADLGSDAHSLTAVYWSDGSKPSRGPEAWCLGAAIVCHPVPPQAFQQSTVTAFSLAPHDGEGVLHPREEARTLGHVHDAWTLLDVLSRRL
ncbi:hypothetical protein K458DRAFT_174485 [Lentithecium fluviatile CBS 122367]|uniref:Uncharacterized protein n=1 Tax=Lentithecium fluviatile CBS 122367 TaxID=1168545 RepID=A0A6G1JD21_9PLEO|nr:hypothetical protein K458DRAFT_174485 [Lentithecium fluviatile CBS 122367]